MSEARLPPRPPAAQYTPEAVAACEKALRTLLGRIGPWGGRMVLVGGLVPRYLVSAAIETVGPHIGTTDLDVVLGVALATDEEEVYRTLQRNLVGAQFHPGRDEDTGQELSYRWQRDDVDGIRVVLEFFCPVGDGEPGRLRRNPTESAGSRISAIRLTGAELAAQDYIVVPLPGEVLDEGGTRDDVHLRVAGVLPFVVLKALALAEREKDKDAYDLVWTLSAFDGGPAGVVAAAACSPVLRSPLVPVALAKLREHFAGIERVGPSRYARFFLGVTDNDDVRDRLRRDAHAVLQLFLHEWEIAGLP